MAVDVSLVIFNSVFKPQAAHLDYKSDHRERQILGWGYTPKSEGAYCPELRRIVFSHLEGTMKKLSISGLLLVGTALFLLAQATNVSGTWNGEMTGDSGSSVDIQFQLKQTGEQVTGTAGPTGVSSPIYDATIQGDHLYFSVGRDPNPIGSST